MEWTGNTNRLARRERVEHLQLRRRQVLRGRLEGLRATRYVSKHIDGALRELLLVVVWVLFYVSGFQLGV